MLTDNDIFFSETDRQALIDSVAEGDSYRIRGIIFNLKNEDGEIEWLRKINTYDWFMNLFNRTKTIECVNEDCSIVKFIDYTGEEIEQLTTTPEFGSALASNPNIYFGHANFTK
jgi:hypothetical protein